MDKYYVFLEAAMELKVLGFDERCLSKYQKLQEIGRYQLQFLFHPRNCNRMDTAISAPSYAQVFDWFEEVHDLKSWIVPCYLEDKLWHSFKVNSVSYTDVGYTTKEEAQKACLLELLNIVKNHGTKN